MADQPPKKLPLSLSGFSEAEAIRIVQEVSSHLGMTLTFEAGSNVSFHFYLPGASMKEQNASHVTTSVGDITDSTVGSIGSAHDVNVFVNRVDSSTLPDDLKTALKNARHELEALPLNDRSKADVAEYLDKVTTELEQPLPDKSRLKHLLGAIKDVAAPVAAALSIAASVVKLLGA